MHTSKQYTIRNVPENVDRYFRKLSEITGKSLNQVIVDELSNSAGQGNSSESLADSLSWFIGSNTIDDETVKFLDDEDRIQKELTRKQWQIDDN